jgi:hypothetical protein
MTSTKAELQHLVADFRHWLSENYSIDEIEECMTDDPSYPKWEEIHTCFSWLIENQMLSNLDQEDQTNLLYLIARNWDIGNMIAWLSSTKQLSNCGELEQNDFVMLAKTLSALSHPEFNDAKSQIVSAFKKLEELTPEIEELLLMFYDDQHEYTKRQALISLGKLGYRDIRPLLKQSWETVNDEHHKMGCLYVVAEFIQDDQLLKNYLRLAENQEGEYLKRYSNKFRS